MVDSAEAAKAAYAAEIDAQAEAAHERAERATAWRREIEAMTGEGTALRGEVRASVRADGLLSALTITDDAAARGARVVQDAVLEALAGAQRDVRAKAHAASVSAWGERDNAVAALDAEVRASTPVPRSETAKDPGREEGTW